MLAQRDLFLLDANPQSLFNRVANTKHEKSGEMKKLLSLAGASLVTIFASATVTSGLVENAEVRGHAIDGIKTALGLPYGVGETHGPVHFQLVHFQPVHFQVAQRQDSINLANPIAPVTSPMPVAVPQSPQSPQPPEPPEPPEMMTKLAATSNCTTPKPNCQSACF